MPSVTLGIETSGRSGRIALRIDGQNVDERELSQAGRRHAQTLIREVRDLLDDHDLKPTEIDVAAASHGPGSFTGLRVGVVCAKTLAWATGCQLAMVDTLLAIAAESPAEFRRVEVVSDAQRDEVFLGQFVVMGNVPAPPDGAETSQAPVVWQREGTIEIVNVEAWAQGLVEKAGDQSFAVAGPGLQKAAEFLPQEIRQLDRKREEPAASTIATLGESLVGAGQLADPMTVEPFYLRKSAAEEKREAAQQSQ